MKRGIALLLALALLLSGCAAGTPAQQTPETAMETTAEPTTEPTTVPTLSPEELLLQSLPENLRQAYEIGFVDLEMLEEPDRVCTIPEAAEILANVYQLTYGEESWMLTHCVNEENKSSNVTRGWFIQMMYTGATEYFLKPESEDFDENMKALANTTGKVTSKPCVLAGELLGYYNFLMMKNNDHSKTGLVNGYYPKNAAVAAHSIYGQYGGAFTYVMDRKEFDGDDAALSYALIRSDRFTGEKLMRWDENYNIRFLDTMTVREVVETALRYHNTLDVVDQVAYEDITTCDKSILTDELLNRPTDLPVPSCQKLPEQWHGVRMLDTIQLMDQDDRSVYEHEIQAIKDAGFNMIQLVLDFPYFEGPWGEEGKLDENRLKELDRVLAWCMERDIHLNLMPYRGLGWPNSGQFYSIYASEKVKTATTAGWAALARRYAEVPDAYLSFTVTNGYMAASEEVMAEHCMPYVEAIRAVTPSRTIIAELQYSKADTGEFWAQQGVALASQCTWPAQTYFDYFSQSSAEKNMVNTVWPIMEKNGDILDAEGAMTHMKEKGKTPDEVAAVAKEYGVGYMVSSWGLRMSYGSQTVFEQRFPDETMQAYLEDMTQTMADRGYGWCYGNWHGFAGIACAYPLVKTATYTKVEGRPLYIDENMTSLFRQVNGVK